MASLVVHRHHVEDTSAPDHVTLGLAPQPPAPSPVVSPDHVVTLVVHRVTLAPVQMFPAPHRSRYPAPVGTGRLEFRAQTMLTPE